MIVNLWTAFGRLNIYICSVIVISNFGKQITTYKIKQTTVRNSWGSTSLAIVTSSVAAHIIGKDSVARQVV
jgi:hypothetical protein